MKLHLETVSLMLSSSMIMKRIKLQVKSSFKKWKVMLTISITVILINKLNMTLKVSQVKN